MMCDFEASIAEGTHDIESDNVLTCAETGRVIAVFYNDYDLEKIVKSLERIQQLEQDNKDLRHDIARQVDINAKVSTENMEMMELLKYIDKTAAHGEDAVFIIMNKVEALIARMEGKG